MQLQALFLVLDSSVCAASRFIFLCLMVAGISRYCHTLMWSSLSFQVPPLGNAKVAMWCVGRLRCRMPVPIDYSSSVPIINIVDSGVCYILTPRATPLWHNPKHMNTALLLLSC
mgnify:CR=1 FL=1